MTDLIIVGDEAWTPEEWEARQQKLARKREAEKARRDRNREAYNAQQRAWAAANRERSRQLKRESERRRRARQGLIVGSLHALACSGPTKATGCRCKKVPVYQRIQEAA